VSETNPIGRSDRVGPANPEEYRLRQACRDLEEIFMRYLVREMKITGGPKTDGPGAAGSDQYDVIIEEAMATALTHSGGIGVADVLYKQLRDAVAGAAQELSPSGLKISQPPSITNAGQSAPGFAGVEETG